MADVLLNVTMSQPKPGATKGLEGELRQLGDTAEKTAGKTAAAGKSMSSFADQMLTGFGMGAAVGFAAQLVQGLQSIPAAVADVITGLVEFGGNLADLSAKTGISTQALQKLAYAGSLVGVSQEEITGAAVKMEKAIADGDTVFQRLGLSVQKLKAMQPDQAFAAVAAQIARIKNPTDQAAAAMEVFGKSGATLLPLLKSDLAAAAAEAERLGIVLSDKTVNAADALGDEATKLEAAWKGVQNQFAAAIIENPALLDGLQGLVKMMGDLSQWVIKNKSDIGAVTGVVVDFARAVAFAFQATYNVLEKTGDQILRVVRLLPGLKDFAKAGGQSNEWTGSGLTSSSHLVQPGVDFSAKGSAAAAAAAQKAAAAAAKAWTDAAEKSRQADDKFTAGVKDNAYQQMLGIQNLLDKRGKAQAKELDAELKREQQHGEMLLALGRKNDQIWQEMEAVKIDKSAAEWSNFGAALQTVGQALGGPFGTAVSGLGGVFEGLGAHQHQAAENLRNYGSTAMTTGQKMQALAGTVLAVANAFERGKQSGDKFNSTLSGAASGAAAGAAFGGVGAIIGGLLGGAAGYAGAAAGQKKILQDLRAEYVRLWNEAEHAGVVFQHTFDPRTPQQYKDAIDEIKGALDIQGQAQQKLTEAVERYGFTIDELGPAFAAQQLDKQMAQIYQDWQLLNAAGVDHEAMMNRIGPSVGSLVDQYVAAGAEIPEAMKPILQDLFEHGKLLHANGVAYTQAELDGLSYAKTMSQMFVDLLTKLNDFINAVNSIVFPDKTLNVNEHYHPDPKRPTGGDPPGWQGPGYNYDNSVDHDGDPTTPAATGFDGWVASPRRFLAGEGGEPEYVSITPASRMAGAGGRGTGWGGGGDTYNVHVTVEGDGDAQKLQYMFERLIRNDGGFRTYVKKQLA